MQHYTVHQKTPEQQRLLQQLQALGAEGIAVCCEVLAASAASWMKLTRKGREWPWLFGKQPQSLEAFPGRFCDGIGNPPAWDHPYERLASATDYTPAHKILGFEPYGLSHRDLKDLLAWAEERNLEVAIDARSPWYPGNTISVELTCVEGAPYVSPADIAQERSLARPGALA